MKRCFKCLEIKELEQFYKHSRMADGHLNKCKDCNKKDTIDNRNLRIEKYRKYDRERGSRRTSEDLRIYRLENPGKYRAHQAVSKAIRNGLLFSEPCCECGRIEDVHAHHDDYSKPLNVRWLCPPCHKDWHKKNGEAPNGR